MRITATALAAVTALAPIAAADHEPCGEPATVYIDIATVMSMPMDDSVTFFIGSTCIVRMTFAAGTAPQYAVDAINAFTGCHELVASHEGHWSNPIKVETLTVGLWPPAMIAQAGCDAPPLLSNDPAGEPSHAITAYGVEGVLGDLDCDGIVGVSDLLILLANWGECDQLPCHGDLNLDGKVDVEDLLILLANWS